MALGLMNGNNATAEAILVDYCDSMAKIQRITAQEIKDRVLAIRKDKVALYEKELRNQIGED